MTIEEEEKYLRALPIGHRVWLKDLKLSPYDLLMQPVFLTKISDGESVMLIEVGHKGLKVKDKEIYSRIQEEFVEYGKLTCDTIIVLGKISPNDIYLKK